MSCKVKKTSAYCGETFVQVMHNPLQQYCSSEHYRAAYKVRRQEAYEVRRLQDRLRASWDVNLVGRCPTPLKIGYSSYQQASHSAWADTNWIYRCVCGALHFTSHHNGVNRKVADLLAEMGSDS